MAAPKPKPLWRLLLADAQVESWALRVVAAPPPATNWTASGNCHAKGLGAMHPQQGRSAIADNHAAVKVCREGGTGQSRCPVLMSCLRATMHAEYVDRSCHGVAGGLTAPFRRKILKVLVARVRDVEAGDTAQSTQQRQETR
jgi:hypothetical protein